MITKTLRAICWAEFLLPLPNGTKLDYDGCFAYSDMVAQLTFMRPQANGDEDQLTVFSKNFQFFLFNSKFVDIHNKSFLYNILGLVW